MNIKRFTIERFTPGVIRPDEHIKTGDGKEMFEAWEKLIEQSRISLRTLSYRMIEETYDDSFNFISSETIAEYRGDIENE